MIRKLTLAALLLSGLASATTYYVAASGADTNDGLTKATAWLHSPGMPSCASNCLKAQNGNAPYTKVGPGDNVIFRGGDVWHFGNGFVPSDGMPTTGGMWDQTFTHGDNPTCTSATNEAGCVYWGVDLTWFNAATCGTAGFPVISAGWCRPHLDGDNPATTSIITGTSCSYQIADAAPFRNTMVHQAYASRLDNFEMIGLCSQRAFGTFAGGIDTYIAYSGAGSPGLGVAFHQNLAIHKWSAAQVVAPFLVGCSLSGTTATCTTASPHGYVVGNTPITVVGTAAGSPGGTNFNGSNFTISAVPDSTHFSYTLSGTSGDTTTGGQTSGLPGLPIDLVSGGLNGLQIFDHFVADGSDSLGSLAMIWAPAYFRVQYSYFQNITDMVGSWCHDIHDTTWANFQPTYYPTHGNIFECNFDAGDATVGSLSGNAPNQPTYTPNVFYNNIVKNATAAFVNQGNVKMWFCPNTRPEFWFNNIFEAVGTGAWSIAGAPTYSGCTNTGNNGQPATGSQVLTGQYMFNNTNVDTWQPCKLGGSNSTNGQYLTVMNELNINTPWDATTGLCTGYTSPTNLALSTATAQTDGYTIANPGYPATAPGPNLCVNDSTKPCSVSSGPSLGSGNGTTVQNVATELAKYTQETEISTTASASALNGTTYGCTYNSTNYTVSCPAQRAKVRPISAPDSGADQVNNPFGTLMSPNTLSAIGTAVH